MEKLLDEVAWKTVEYREIHPSEISDVIPHVTHEGVLDFGDAKFIVYQLSNGMRIIDAEDLNQYFRAFGC